MLITILIINWPVFLKLLSLDWSNNSFTFTTLQIPHGGEDYLPTYLTFMAIFCVFPYFEENIRCLRAVIKNRQQQQI